MLKGVTLDRFNRDKEPVTLTLVEPVVAEVSADTAWSSRSPRPEGKPAFPHFSCPAAGASICR